MERVKMTLYRYRPFVYMTLILLIYNCFAFIVFKKTFVDNQEVHRVVNTKEHKIVKIHCENTELFNSKGKKYVGWGAHEIFTNIDNFIYKIIPTTIPSKTRIDMCKYPNIYLNQSVDLGYVLNNKIPCFINFKGLAHEI